MLAKRAIICGGRNYARTDIQDLTPTDCLKKICEAISLCAFLDMMGFTSIIEGGAKGADRAARTWAIARNISYETFNANWTEEGRAAGPIRNARMLEEGDPDIVIAFPGGRGTSNMMDAAGKRGIAVLMVLWE